MHKPTKFKSLQLATVIALAALAGCDRGAPDTSATGGATARPGTGSATPGTTSTPPSSTSTSGTSSTTGSSSTTVAQANTGATAAPGGSASVSASDRKFMMEAAGDGMYEVAVGKLAAEKANSPAVKKFGETMVSDHTKANNELKQLASTKGVTLPGELPADKKVELERLSKASGASFDKQFVQTVGLKDHMADIKKFETAARESQDPQLKAFAQKTLPTLQQHHSTAEKLAKAGGGSKSSSTGTTSSTNRAGAGSTTTSSSR